MEVLEMPQGSAEWLTARCAIPTASCASQLMAKGQGKTRMAYMYKLIGEAITGEPVQTWEGNAHTERGHAMEPVARELYERRTGNTVEQCGFIRAHDDIGGAGYSPDGLVGDDGAIEIKSRMPHIQAELLDTGKIPRDAYLQMQFGLWVCGRYWCDYVSYWPGMPLFVERVIAHYETQSEIREAVVKFHADMQEKLAKLAEMG